MTDNRKLQRSIGLMTLIFYGIGDILGAGVYGLIGKAAGELGNGIWIGFVIGGVAAGLTGLSYASLGSRYPQAGGCASIIRKAFRSDLLAYVMGLAVVFAALTSMATSGRAFSGYLLPMLNQPWLTPLLGVFVFIALIAIIVSLGIRDSMRFNVVCTLIEVTGLTIVVLVGFRFLGSVDYFNMATAKMPSPDIHWGKAFSGAMLTFYSFIGFEDMLNVSEEVKNPVRNIPTALLISVGVSSAFYLLIALVAVSVVPPDALANSTQPLVEVVRTAAPWFPVKLFGIISLFALFNTALLNFITASRLIYGMSKEKLMPAFLGKVSGNGSPYMSIITLVICLITLVSFADIANLARSTSALLLVSYTLMNIALVRLKKTDKPEGKTFEIPSVFPIAGAVICVVMLGNGTWEETIIVATLYGIAIALYYIMQPHPHLMERLHLKYGKPAANAALNPAIPADEVKAG